MDAQPSARIPYRERASLAMHSLTTTPMVIAIFGNTYKRQTLTLVEHILAFCSSRHVRVLLSKELRYEMQLTQDYEGFNEDTDMHIDYAISVGGDGTFLTTASAVYHKRIPIVGINCGHLGFLTAFTQADIDEMMEMLLKKEVEVEERSLLQVSTQGGGHIMMPYALNEVAVLKQELSSMITIDTYVNSQLLNTYRADGLVVATPTGSTAYSLSAGGPLVAPYVPAIVLTPIATHSLNVRPLVIGDDRIIELHVHSRSGSFLISVDGRSQAIKEDVCLEIKRAEHKIKIVHANDHSFIQTLKNKLLWGAE